MKNISEIIMLIKSLKDINEIDENTLLVGDILDSFDLLTLVTEIEKVSGMTIPLEEMVPENFKTPTTIFELIKKL